ncbi:MAG: hemerythrin [Candidatus Brocadia sp.]|nr:hemerythrin domain-containing protein [Candidatus Brocadia sp.]MCE7910384.1 hemerythrin domain-containing protein [Candidatus Brocadia sp. AMX3]MDG5995867.1 hemerythrin domain-containing protein [Candidatus Brocadia sp.]RIK02914.1 MAG: hemerythrin [Candidatus Brocadia sp.]UJS20983.1 MAG: hemerythrin domain-containing protein [Candidatus Brocadia sp.]
MNRMVKLDPIAEFREDHRKVRDGLLELMEALQSKNVAKARKILDEINVLVGPHFRYEEEVLYPTLRVFLGEYVDQLLTEHDGVIATARSCAGLLKKDSLTDEEAKLAVSAARALLVHVSNCDGLSILSERLNKNEIDALSEKLATARKAGVPLLDWADTIRNK